MSDQEDFWVGDAAVSYRLPKRWGLLTVGVSNLFDEQFKCPEKRRSEREHSPARAVFARLTLAFP